MTRDDPEGNGAQYVCRHYDEGTHLCTAYEQRPDMCSRFPYNRICGACGLIGPEVPEDGIDKAEIIGYKQTRPNLRLIAKARRTFELTPGPAQRVE